MKTLSFDTDESANRSTARQRLTFLAKVVVILLTPLITVSCSPTTQRNASIEQSSVSGTDPIGQGPYPDFETWKRACDRLPTNLSLQGLFPSRELLPLPDAREFDRILKAAFEHFQSGRLARPENWTGTPPDPNTFFDTSRIYYEHSDIPFTPFAQKLAVAPGEKFLIHGDFHGDIHSLIAFLAALNDQSILDGFRLRDERTSFLFLGDYTDRGVYGVEVIYTLLRLLLANPDRVHLVRGNHEDISLTAEYGFFTELAVKFGKQYDVRLPMRLYDFLPVVLYLGSGDNYVQCNHGGMEPGYRPALLLADPAPLGFELLGTLLQKKYCQHHPDFLQTLSPDLRPALEPLLQDFVPANPVSPAPLGFMWNDFSLLIEETALTYNPGRAWVYGEKATHHLLSHATTGAQKVQAVIRAHQHSGVPNPMMMRLIAARGVHRHWQLADGPALLYVNSQVLAQNLETGPRRKMVPGAVYTFNVAPDSVYGMGCGYDFDAWARLTTAESFENWTLEVFSQTLPPR